MAIIRLYQMEAAEGQEAALLAALKALGAELSNQGSFSGFEILQDREERRSMTFIERWTSVDAHRAAAAHFPRERVAAIKATLSAPIRSSYLDVIDTQI